MRWATYGWQLGQITDVITKSTPRLFQKFNFRIVWTDGSKGPANLAVSNYGFGADARYDSWVILTGGTAGRVGPRSRRRAGPGKSANR